MSATKKRQAGKKAKRRRSRPNPLPATGSKRDAPHFGRAVRGCACMSCQEHRALLRRDEREWRRQLLYSDDPMVVGSVMLGSNATPELRAALRGQRMETRS